MPIFGLKFVPDAYKHAAEVALKRTVNGKSILAIANKKRDMAMLKEHQVITASYTNYVNACRLLVNRKPLTYNEWWQTYITKNNI